MATIKELEKERAELKAAGKALLKEIKIKEADGNAEEAEVSLTDLQKIKVKLDEVSDSIQALITEEFNEPDDEATDESSDEDTSPEKAFSAPVIKGTNMNKKININTKWGSFKDYSAKGEEFGRQALTQHMAKAYGGQEAHAWATKHFGDEQMMTKLQTKATGPNTIAGSGVQPADYSSEVIELMYAQGVLLPYLNVEQLPYGNKGWFRHRLGASAAQVLENGTMPVTQNAWDLVPITWKKYGAKTYATKEMVEFTPLSVVNTILNNLTTECALYKEQRLFFGVGGANDITGILNGVAEKNVFSSTVNGSLYSTQSIANDLENTTLKLAESLVEQNGVVHFSSYGVNSFLRQYRAGPGYSDTVAFPEINQSGSWNGVKIEKSNLIPSLGTLTVAGQTFAGTTVVSPFITVQPKHIRIAEPMGGFRIDSTDVGSFMDGETQVNTWDTDLIAFKATGYVESMIEHDVAVSVLLTKGWSLNAIDALHYYTQAASGKTASGV